VLRKKYAGTSAIAEMTKKTGPQPNLSRYKNNLGVTGQKNINYLMRMGTRNVFDREAAVLAIA
jgi:hypothetical protein